MPKIIKQGYVPKSDLYRLTCHKCNTVALFEQAEVQRYSYDGSYLKCPVCSTFTNLENKNIDKVADYFRHLPETKSEDFSNESLYNDFVDFHNKMMNNYNLDNKSLAILMHGWADTTLKNS